MMLIFLLFSFGLVTSDSFVEVKLLKNKMDDPDGSILLKKKLENVKPMTIAGVYKNLFLKRYNNLPSDVVDALKELQEGKDVKGDKQVISREFSRLLVNVFKCVDTLKSSKQTSCHVKAWRGFIRVTQLLWFVSKPTKPINGDTTHLALAFSMQRYITGLIKVINKLSGTKEPTSAELKEVRKVPWEKVYKFANLLKCDNCSNEIIYFSGNSMYESINDFLLVLWNYKISHPTQFSMIPTLGGDKIESLIGLMISDKSAPKEDDEL